ncbi:MAG: PAS domain S-box protein, partial [Sideroxyarcus sp.]|nr:PAS domain S-box protein [Sideroxyarcus sp.]
REELKAKWTGRVEKAIQSHGNIEPMETMVICQDGSSRYVRISLASIESKNIITFEDLTERKQAEQDIAESESRFREIFNTVSDAIFIHDAETGRIIDVNHRMLEMYGLTREEAFACGPDDLSAGTPPYSSAEAIEKIRLAHTEGPQIFDWLARARDGHLFWSEVNLRFVLIGNQRRILAVVRDITERKLAEAKLIEQLDELRRWHDVTSGREGRILELKHEVNELLGKSGLPPRYPSAESDAMGHPDV